MHSSFAALPGFTSENRGRVVGGKDGHLEWPHLQQFSSYPCLLEMIRRVRRLVNFDEGYSHDIPHRWGRGPAFLRLEVLGPTGFWMIFAAGRAATGQKPQNRL